MAAIAQEVLPGQGRHDPRSMRHRHNSHPITYAGRTFASYTEAAYHYRLLPQVVRRRLAKGQPLEVRHLGREHWRQE